MALKAYLCCWYFTMIDFVILFPADLISDLMSDLKERWLAAQVCLESKSLQWWKPISNKWSINLFISSGNEGIWGAGETIITVSYIQTQNLNIPVGISKIPEEGVWPSACVCLLGNIWIDSATVQWRCPAETLLPRQGFVTSVRSAVGGLARLNLDPGSQHRLTSPLPPVTDGPSNYRSFIVLWEHPAGLNQAPGWRCREDIWTQVRVCPWGPLSGTAAVNPWR